MAINTKTYLSKSNTIIRDAYTNTGLNPVVELNYGNVNTRALIYFDHNKVKSMVENGTYPDITKLRHVLKMTNAASVDVRPIYDCTSMDYDGKKQRAASFDLIFFLIPQYWDEGKGFDYVQDLYVKNHRAHSIDGSSWFYATNTCTWDEEGIYSTDKLSIEVDKFTSKKGNLSKIIIGIQHFDFGNEPLELDITETMNKFITGELENYGIGIAFSPAYEMSEPTLTQYVGFFSKYTNTFYEPYVETTYDEVLEDDRANFYCGKTNKLYFYASVGGEYTNLDEVPTCTIEGAEMPVKMASKGIYYVEVNGDDYEPDTMYYDVWSNLKYKGRNLKDVELSFTPVESDGYYIMGLPKESKKIEYIPNLYGILIDERIQQGDVRKINIDLNIPYTSNQMRGVDGIEYRVYVKEDNKETNVIDYASVERGYNENFFLLDTKQLVPARYYVDIKITQNLEERHHYEMLTFDIVGDRTKYYN